MTDDELDKLLYAGMSPGHIEAEKAYWRAARDFGMAELRKITAIEMDAPDCILGEMKASAKVALETALLARDRLFVFQSAQIDQEIKESE